MIKSADLVSIAEMEFTGLANLPAYGITGISNRDGTHVASSLLIRP